MTISFEVEPEFQQKLDWVKRLCEEELEPLYFGMQALQVDARRGKGGGADKGEPRSSEQRDTFGRVYRANIKRLQEEVQKQGLWGLHLGPELGGPGLGQVKLSLLNEILGRHPMASSVFGTMAPDTGNMELIAHYGTPEQKRKWLDPLAAGEMRSSYSMTEPHAGSDPGEFKCRAWREGDEWVLEGEKWFSSYASTADVILVMAITNPDAPLKERASIFLVPGDAPGIEVIRHVHLMQTPYGEGGAQGAHGYIRYNKVRLSADALLGPEGSGFLGSQTRLAGGRVHHAMRAVGNAQHALDMMCERVLSRHTKGSMLFEKQMIQEKIADCYIAVHQFRLHVLYTAWLIDRDKAYTPEVRKHIAAVKVSAPKVLHDCVATSLHVHGSLGVTNETPLGQMWMSVPWMGIVDGPTEVHKVTVAEQVLKGYAPAPDLFPSYHVEKQLAKGRAYFAKMMELDVGNL
jgi:acyl-CoA dehydrogenase